MWGDGSLNVDITWSKVLEELKSKLSSLSFRTWFDETELYKLHNGKAYILVPLPMHKNHLKSHYYDLVHDALYHITETDYDLIFILKDEIENDYVMKQSAAQDKYKIVDGIVGEKEEYGIAFRKEDSDLRDAVDKAFDELVQEGKIAPIVAKYFGESNGFKR